MSQADHSQKVMQVYRTIMGEVCSGVREAFLDDGADDAALNDLRSLWEAKVKASGVLTMEAPAPPPVPQQTRRAEAPSGVHHVHPGMAGGRGEKREPAYQPRLIHNPALGGAGLVQASSSAPSQAVSVAAAALAQQQHHIRAAQAQAQAQAHAQMAAAAGGQTMYVSGGVGGQPRFIQLVPQGGGAPGGLLPAGVQLVRLPNGTIAQAPVTHRTVISKVQAHQRQPPQLDGASYAEDDADQPSSSSAAAGAPPKAKRRTKEVEIQLVMGTHEGAPSQSFKARVSASSALFQVDGALGGSDSEESDGEELLDVEEEEAAAKDLPDDDDDERPAHDGPEPAMDGEEAGEPLNSDDDEEDADENAEALFDCDDTVVCQFDKVTRIKNKWKFVLKDGVINIAGKDYLFNKANGEAEW